MIVQTRHEIDYVAQVQEILKVLAILPDGWIFPIGEVALGGVYDQWGYPVQFKQ